MIILPCTFLLNTSNVKDKVVDHGWVYAFKNVSSKSEETKILKGSQAIKQPHIKPSKLPYDNDRHEIFATSSSANIKVRNNKVGISQKVSFESEPCSSKGNYDTKKRHHTDITALDVNLLPQQEHKKETISQRGIRNMTEHLHEEEKYIEYFKQFVVNTGNQSDENACLELQLNCESLPNYISVGTSKDKHNKRKGKRSNQTVEISKKIRKPKLVQYNEERNELHNIIIFKGQKNDRILIRRKILTQLCAFDEHEELYNSFKEALISTEESFIQ
jgi:hypothetical protein